LTTIVDPAKVPVRFRGGDMIEPGASAPGFSLKDHLGREVQLADHRDRHHVLLLFYPLDWTPT
jgi:peroxiredoxin